MIGCDYFMLTLNFFETFTRELVNFFKDIQKFLVDIISSIHHFLNRFMSDEVILMFGILIAAFLAIMIFRYVINKR